MVTRSTQGQPGKEGRSEATSGLARIGADGRVLWANEAFERLVRYDDESRGKLTPDGLLQRLGLPPTTTSEAVRALAADGTWAGRAGPVGEGEAALPLLVELHVEPTTLGDWLAVVRPVTEMPDASIAHGPPPEPSPSEKLESLGLLAGGVAHDFNNLLMGVLAEASLALEELPPHSPAASSLTRIETASRRMAGLARQLLAYAGQAPGVAQVVDANALVQEVIDLLRRRFPRGVFVFVDIAAAPAYVLADPNQLRQVVMNIVMNAADALMSNAGVVRVTTGERPPMRGATGEGTWSLEVSDSGCGMDEATKRRMFDPFFSTKGSGRGLGLSAVQGILRRMGARIEIESAVGEGTTVQVVVPRATAPASCDARGCGSVAPPPHLRVLVVDDEHIVRRTARRMVQRLGHAVVVAEDGAEARRAIQAANRPFDLVIVDMRMPRVDGPTFVNELRHEAPATRVLVMSGHAEPGAHLVSADHWEALGDAYLVKPFSLRDLEVGILRAFEAPRQA
jgi:signal transduction histidine kinase/CheY-like chemotaxis protein